MSDTAKKLIGLAETHNRQCKSSDCTITVWGADDFCDECQDEMHMGVRDSRTGDPFTNYDPQIRKDLRAHHGYAADVHEMLPFLVLKDGTELFADLPAMALLDMDNRVFKQFDDEMTMTKFIRDNEDASAKAADEDDVGRHIFHWKSPTEPPQLSLEQRKAFEVFRDGDFAVLLLPADPQVLQREGVAMQHCLGGDTKVVTFDGTFPIKDLVGKPVKLLTRPKLGKLGAWVDAEIRSFGTQPLSRITLTRNKEKKVLLATAEHRWHTERRRGAKRVLTETLKTTGSLSVGDALPTLYRNRVLLASESKKGVSLSAVGVMHGMVFGDGHKLGGQSVEDLSPRPAQITLYGHKDEQLLPWFSQMDASKSKVSTRSIGGVTVGSLPRYFKELPPMNESASYLIGWLAGYVAADGNVTKNGYSGLSSATLEHLEFAEMLCQRFGIKTRGISSQTRTGFGKTCLIHTLKFMVGCLPDSFFLTEEHRLRNRPRERKDLSWIVESVVPNVSTEEVFCAVVPGTECFVIEGNILTGNCLAYLHNDYAARQKTGEIVLYSLLDLRDNDPKVDIELAVTRDSYRRNHDRPTIIQIRGKRNECPPKDEYILPIQRFFDAMGNGWNISDHNDPNFDGKVDGKLFKARVQALQQNESAAWAVDNLLKG